jgi:hypothetical protein
VDRRNESRKTLFLEEQSELKPLPAKNFPCYTQFDCLVTSNAIITGKQNRYSVPSCYIGHRVQIRVLADSIELWHAAKKQLAMPRLVGKGSENVDFRHVIDSLVRKPGAFANYRYREHMYPTMELRKAFDHFVERLGEGEGTRVYLRLLLLSKQEGLAATEPVMAQLKAMGDGLTKKAAFALLETPTATSMAAVRDADVEVPDLDTYDDLLEHKEVLDDQRQGNDSEFEQLCESAVQPIGTGAEQDMGSGRMESHS